MNEKTVMPRAMKRKKFYCSCCGEKLVPYPKTRIIKRGDPDYKEHRNIGFGRRLIGDIKLFEYDFKCLSCDKFMSYDEQCVIAEIQKHVGSHILTQDNINENIEKAKTTLERKRNIEAVIGKVIATVLTVLIIYYGLKSGNLKIYF